MKDDTETKNCLNCGELIERGWGEEATHWKHHIYCTKQCGKEYRARPKVESKPKRRLKTVLCEGGCGGRHLINWSKWLYDVPNDVLACCLECLDKAYERNGK